MKKYQRLRGLCGVRGGRTGSHRGCANVFGILDKAYRTGSNSKMAKGASIRSNELTNHQDLV